MGIFDTARQEMPERPPEERVKDWEPFHSMLSDTARAAQGSRCMDCGVPFCQSGMEFRGAAFGCPLHNLIPEWNDLLAMGNPSQALRRLCKTNNFPEFTGRVCPAPCEQACVSGRYRGSPVTIRENELSVIEAAFAAGEMQPRQTPLGSGRKVAIVGSGPAGLAAADQLNQRGHTVAVYEREQHAGGLLMYGIPSMKLPKDIVRRRIALMEQEGVRFITGADAAEPALAARLMAEYDAVLLCCGAEKPRPLGLDDAGVTGVYIGTDYLKSAVERESLGRADAPVPGAAGKNVVIIGTGDTASDCLATALRQGCASAVQLIRRPQSDYLRDGALPLDYAHEEAAAVLGEDPRRFGVRAAELITGEDGALAGVVTTDGDTIPCELLLAATGFSGCADDVCAAFGVEKGDTVRTAAGSYGTNVPGVFAAGDMRRGQSLVVWAIAEGRSAAAEIDEYLLGYTSLVRPQ